MRAPSSRVPDQPISRNFPIKGLEIPQKKALRAFIVATAVAVTMGMLYSWITEKEIAKLLRKKPNKNVNKKRSRGGISVKYKMASIKKKAKKGPRNIKGFLRPIRSESQPSRGAPTANPKKREETT